MTTLPTLVSSEMPGRLAGACAGFLKGVGGESARGVGSEATVAGPGGAEGSKQGQNS